MKKMFGVLMAVMFFGVSLGAVNLCAEESADSSVTTLKDELAADREVVKEQKETMKTNAQGAKSEEKDIKAQIKEARLAGDKEKVKALKAQLKTLHQENVQGMKGDKAKLQSAKKEVAEDNKKLHQERKAARTERRTQKQR